DHLILVKITDPTPGIWRIILQGEVIANGEFHAWLPITGIADPNVEFASPDPDYTVVIPATAVGALVCGAYDSRDNSLYIASSWGPTRVPRLAPDFTAPGVNVGGAVPGGGHGVFTGTSVAAAITTGASAILLQWGIVEGHEFFMNSARIRALLIRGCDRHPNIQYPNVQWGYGSINLMSSFRVLSG
ncbi:MAG TPA: S8 family serine peptidase, partial [Clostridia bacterium]|nr:S8 family serine peptidase [Clostridia bacterium]